MSILLVGINHKSAPVELRELLAFSEEACTEGLRQLVDGDVVQEALIVSTCNRVEVLTSTVTTRAGEGKERVAQFLSQSRRLPLSSFHDHIYHWSDDDAVRHLFRVASSLDSMVVGEPQVLGQVRRAYALAREAGTAGKVLNRLVHHAFRVAKRVRSETGIASNAVSISYMAVELGKKIFNSLQGHTVLLIGAGEMAELSARHLLNAGVERVLIANRSEAAASELAHRLGHKAVSVRRIEEHMAEADIVICSTGADHYVVTENMAREALDKRRNRPSFFIDISVPRNVDPRIGELPNTFVFDVDDLESVITSNIREREREAERAELIVESEIMQFQRALRALDFGPGIGALRQKLQDIARLELTRQRSKLGPLTPEQEKAVEALLLTTVKKISHPVLHQMRRSSEMADADPIQAWLEAFGSDEPAEK